MHTLYLVSVWLHVLAAAVWVGGMVFFALVLVPVVRAGFGEVRAALLSRLGLRLRALGWGMLALLVLTGVLNLVLRGVSWEAFRSGALWDGGWGHTLLAKLGLVGIVLALSATHDFWVGPRAMALTHAEGDTPRARAYTRAARWNGRLMLLLSLATLWLGVALSRGGL